LGGGEAATGYVNPSTNVAYFSDTPAKSLPNDFNGSVSDAPSWTKFPDESYYPSNASDVEFDPRYYKHVYLGRTKSLWKSMDNGLTFTELKNFDNGNAGCQIKEIEVSRSNPNYIYVYVNTASYAASLFRSTDGGATWTEKAFPASGNNQQGSITLSATDENKLWVMFTNGDNDKKVYATTNAGTNCDWTNISSPLLNGQALQTILNQAGTNELYVGTGSSVYRYTSGAWQTFNSGLPVSTSCNLLRGYYRTNKLRVSTYGYGIWETDFAIPSPPVAQPMVDKITSNCGRTAFLFDDYSVAKSDATYAWSFLPTPQYVSSATARNPQVIFGAVGNYSATLTVTDANGTSTKTVSNIVSISTDNCAIQTTPTSSGTFAGTQTSFARASAAPNFGTSQDFSVGFWFKSASTSGSAAMVTEKNFFNSYFKGWVIALGNGRVHLNISDYEGHQIDIFSANGFNDNKWHHAAASVTRTGNAVLYVDGVSAGSASAAALLSINSGHPICIGQDAINNYVYAGDIDEVKIWNVALTQAQIRERMHLTAPASEANLINYYQFNESTTNEYDRGSNGYNLTFSNTATRSTSTAPVGGGSAFRMTVNSAGVKDFTGTNCQINFAGSTLPNGEVVVSMLNVSPDQNPTTGVPLSNKYWIVDNYGINAGLTLTSVSFGNLGSFVAGGLASNYKLFKRSSNAHGATWGASIDAADALTTTNNNTLTFSTGNGIKSFSQFTIARDAVLKVELLSFDAVLRNKQVDIAWKVADEKDVNHYIIERSLDGKTFDFLKKQEKGNFSSADEAPQYGVNYYRLKVVENDGQITYSPIRSVNFETGKKTDFKVYPNPTADVLNVEFNAERAQDMTVELFDNLGRMVHTYDFTSKEGNNHLFFNTQRFAAGLYTLKIQQGATVVTEKIVIR
jgi:Concanavalin A-like lectin/glucanases superfamily/Secretion system C-terminal sorting domain/Sortilin, neurotensin receptor 3,